MNSKDAILNQIDEALQFYDKHRQKAKYDDLSDLDDAIHKEVETILETTLDRLSPKESGYRKTIGKFCQYMVGSLRALRRDYAAGYLTTVEGLIRSEVFADFMEMAEHLLEQGYKDPAAVLIGGVLEDHIRTLCTNYTITITSKDKPKKADRMNAELAALSVYSKLDQKQITAWLDLRNKAAHGKYKEYSKEQVELLLAGVRDFVIRTSS